MTGVLLAALLALPAEELTLPPFESGPFRAGLAIRVAEQTPQPGTGRVRLRLTAEGPADLAVEGPWLEDATSAWRVPLSASSFTVDGRARWECTVELAQTKPGLAALPGVRLRLHAGGRTVEPSWPDPLHEAADGPDVVEPPPPPPSPWPGRLRLVGLTALAAALAAALALLVRRWRLRPAPTPAPAAVALAAIDRPGEGGPADARVAELDRVVRRYLEARGLPANRATPVELLAAAGAISDRESTRGLLAAFFARCEGLKFAGAAVMPVELEGLRQSARELVVVLAKEGEGAKAGGAG